jgi:hypothetical protein
MASGNKWIIVLVAFDDPEIPTQVIKERIPGEDDEKLAAFLRGGDLVAVVGTDQEHVAEGYRLEAEKNCLR